MTHLTKPDTDKIIEFFADKRKTLGDRVVGRTPQGKIIIGRFCEFDLERENKFTVLEDFGTEVICSEILGSPILKCHVEAKMVDLLKNKIVLCPRGKSPFLMLLHYWNLCGLTRSLQEIFSEWEEGTVNCKFHSGDECDIVHKFMKPEAEALGIFLRDTFNIETP